MAVNQAGHRIDVLAKHRQLHPLYRENRRSVYWVDKEPLKPGPDGSTAVDASPRVLELSRHKTADGWHPDRPSASWPVSETAKSASASPRIIQLSGHRNPHRSYLFDRSPEWDIPRSALSSSSSPRLDRLATPKNRADSNSYYDPYWGYRSPIEANILKASCSPRVEALSAFKDYHKNFTPARPVQWTVSREALQAIASIRLQQLSRPPSRALTKDDFDPYRIPSGALRAQSTPRLDELALPIPRKVRAKRIV
ncbi:testicular haploid expressed protein [Biomphalaria pfeifferi]|uniref:Testicular haploid expressed protein n=1 Tax=Biomphalaria pfeifferi TaxID=112525 RepID=A0AAD8AW82_BIOPF|nr:testicular haploid expressed protein [Biomphalaria pfeifferi]